MFRYLFILLGFVVCLPGAAAAVEWPDVSEDRYSRLQWLCFPEPVVSETVVDNGRSEEKKDFSDQDLGRDVFTITGDEKYKPITRWRDQDRLEITYPKGTSCKTEYKFRMNPGTKYLGGAPVVAKERTLRLPAGRLAGHRFMDDRGMGIVVYPEQQLSREDREFSIHSGLRYVFRKARRSIWTDETYYVGCVEGVVEPAYLKYGVSEESLKLLNEKGKEVWSKLGRNSELPGHVVVRPAKPLELGENWHLLVVPREGDGFRGDWSVCSNATPSPELGTGVEWRLSEDKKKYQLVVSFSEPMRKADMPALFNRMKLLVGTREAESAGKGRKTLKMDGYTLEFRYVGVEKLKPVICDKPGQNDETDEEKKKLSYVYQDEVKGFIVEVSSPSPVLLDVVLPADTKSALGFGCASAHHHRISMSPAMPVLEPGANIILPLKGDRCLRMPSTNLESVQVNAWKLAHEMTATAYNYSLSSTVDTTRRKLVYDLLSAREWRGYRLRNDSLSEAEDALDSAVKAERRHAARSRKVLEGATAFPGCKVQVGQAGMLQSGETVLKLDDATGGRVTPGMYLLRLSRQANRQVRSALRQMERAEESMDAHEDVLVQVTDLNVTMGKDAILVNRYSDGKPVAQASLSYLDNMGKPRQLSIRDGIGWFPGNLKTSRRAWVHAGNDVVLVSLPSRYHLDDGDETEEKSSTLLVLDRPLYRPGDTVNLRGVLRLQKEDGSCAIPAEKMARVSFYRPNGAEIESRELPLGDYGAFETSFTLPTGEDDITGEYEIRVECGTFRESTYANCQVFRRDAFMTTLVVEVDPVAPREFTARVSAVDYSGTPLGGARCELEVGGEHHSLSLDTEGKATLTLPVTDEMRKSGGISVSGSVVNDREEYVQLPDEMVSIHPADFYMDLQTDRIRLYDSRTDKVLAREQRVLIQMVNDDEQPLPGPNGLGYVGETKKVLWSGEVIVPAGSELGVPLPVKVADWGNKADKMVASGTDAEGREVEKTLPIYRVVRVAESERLKVDAKSGSAELRADLPRGGTAHLFVGCGQKLRHLNLPVQAGERTYQVPLQESEEGSLQFTLVLPGDAPLVKSERFSATGFVPIRRNHLAVELNLPQQVCRPAEVVTISGCVLAGGQPADAEVTLYAVDAGMMSVAKYRYPDPEAFFFQRDAREFDLSDRDYPVYYDAEWPVYRSSEHGVQLLPAFWLGDLVGLGHTLTPESSMGRDSALATILGNVICRVGLNELPPWVLEGDTQYQMPACAPAPLVMAVKSGSGVYSAKTKGLGSSDEEEEEEGAWDSHEEPPPAEFMAYCAPAEDQEGVPQPRLRTNFSPVAVWKGALKTDAEGRFSAEVTLPDTLTSYEVIAVAVDRSGNRFGSARGDFTVAQPVMLTPGTPLFMSLDDVLRLPLSIVNNTDEPGTWRVTLEGAAEPQEITLEARSSGTLFFDFKATTEGEQKLRWTAVGKPGSDAVPGEFSVRFPAPVLKETHRLTLSSGDAAVQLAALLGVDVGAATRGELELVASANPLLHLAGAADYLLEYPYGCTEQRASALIPWLLYDDLAPFCPKMAKTRPEEVKKVVQKIISELLPRQCEDGGLAFWGGWNQSSLWATAHAGYVLKLAQEKGYDVPQEAMDKLYRYLWWTSDRKMSARTRFAIARTRGKTGQMKDILREMLELEEELDFRMLGRETRATMQFMLSMLEKPDEADAAFRTWLRTAGHDYRHGTTQGNAWHLLALVEYLKLKKEQGTEASLQLQDGTQLRLGKGATVVPLPWQTGQEMKSLDTAISAAGGTVYARLQVRALPDTSDYPGVTERGLQVTRLYETKGADGVWRPATSFKVGDVVRVTLTCAKVTDELKYFVLEDYLPASMEAINPEVPSQAAGLEPMEWSHAFDHREYLADRVRGFCTRWEDRNLLNMRYYARVKRAGTAAAPPAQAQLMYEPQVYGLSPNTRVATEP